LYPQGERDQEDKNTKETEKGQTKEGGSTRTSHQKEKQDSQAAGRGHANVNSEVKCPLFKIPYISCGWIGKPGNLEKHLTQAHSSIVKRSPTFTCSSLSNNVLVILSNNEIFLYYKYISYTDIWYAVVQKVGITNKKFRYKIDFLSENFNDNLTFRHEVSKTTEPFEIIFDARNCMAIRRYHLEPFIRNGEICMIVAITEAPVSRKREHD
jgi:hypothetical protein